MSRASVAEQLARIEEGRELRRRLYAGGLAPDHRKVIEARIQELIAADLEEANAEAAAAYQPPPELPATVRAMSPAEAAAKATALRQHRLFFKAPTYSTQTETEALRAEVAALDRRAAESD